MKFNNLRNGINNLLLIKDHNIKNNITNIINFFFKSYNSSIKGKKIHKYFLKIINKSFN